MFRRLLNGESGYSVIEVLASITILTIAIIPMVGLFDTGFRGATASSNFDKGRALANLKMEEAKSLSFDAVTSSFPVDGSDPNLDGDPDGYYDSGFIPETGPASGEFTNFEYRVEKQYLTEPPTNPDSPSQDFGPETDTATSLMRVTVTVGWGTCDPDGDTCSKTYTTYGLVAA